MDIIVPKGPDIHIHSILDDLDVRNFYMNVARLDRAYETYCLCKLEEDIDDEIRKGLRDIETRKRVQEALEW